MHVVLISPILRPRELLPRAAGALMNDEPVRETETERIGIFPNWRWLYGTVVVYTAVLIVILYIFTTNLDLSGR